MTTLTELENLAKSLLASAEGLKVAAAALDLPAGYVEGQISGLTIAAERIREMIDQGISDAADYFADVALGEMKEARAALADDSQY